MDNALEMSREELENIWYHKMIEAGFKDEELSYKEYRPGAFSLYGDIKNLHFSVQNRTLFLFELSGLKMYFSFILDDEDTFKFLNEFISYIRKNGIDIERINKVGTKLTKKYELINILEDKDGIVKEYLKISNRILTKNGFIIQDEFSYTRFPIKYKRESDGVVINLDKYFRVNYYEENSELGISPRFSLITEEAEKCFIEYTEAFVSKANKNPIMVPVIDESDETFSKIMNKYNTFCLN